MQLLKVISLNVYNFEQLFKKLFSLYEDILAETFEDKLLSFKPASSTASLNIKLALPRVFKLYPHLSLSNKTVNILGRCFCIYNVKLQLC
jgi:hypothetical protein